MPSQLVDPRSIAPAAVSENTMSSHPADQSPAMPTIDDAPRSPELERTFESHMASLVDEPARRRFEEAWLNGQPCSIDECLPAPDHPAFLGTLEELVHLDLEFRWKPENQQTIVAAASQREHVLVEHYLARFPQLDVPEILRRLLRQEFRVRHRHGQAPEADEYRQRFPSVIVSSGDLGAPIRPQRTAVESHRIEGYEIEEFLGRGGMGIVYKARQKRLNRTVAVKMLLVHAVAGGDDLQRFRTEVEATAALRHSHIVRVHEFGESDGRPFYSMEYIDGPSLQQRLDECPLAGRVAARYIAPVARAIHHAHRHGILHRDLKPSNILLDANDQPHVTDFGIAKRLAEDAGPTRTGSIIGTPGYMAPEQAAGRKDLTAATDVYGLGALLYALLTGRPPFLAETLADTLQQVLESMPVPPRLLNSNVDRDLETICLKCLEKDPSRRYPDAEALAADLERFLADEPIAARSVNLFDRLARAVNRSTHDVEFHSWGTILLVLAALVFVSHTAIFVSWHLGLARSVRWAIGAVEFTLIGMGFWWRRPGRLLPSSAAERQLWTIWLGYFLSFAMLALIDIQLVTRDESGAVVGSQTESSHWSIYPYSALLAGFAFFVMGSAYWGGCYLIGLMFLVTSGIMPRQMEVAPLTFALLWSASLCVLGLRLRRLGHTQSQALHVSAADRGRSGS
jgi:serine/threonine protein kinase